MTHCCSWHQDINPKNILIKSRPGVSVYDFECKLADLGISHFKRSLSWEEDGTDTAAYGTRTYGTSEVTHLKLPGINSSQAPQNSPESVVALRTKNSASNRT